MVVTFRDPEPGGDEGAGAEDAQAFELDNPKPTRHESHKEKKARLNRQQTTDVELEQHRHGNW